ncbi:amidase [Halorussus litoreus]|uniref:amidase n=1 Tax=Halorussus litoreus TaxID=1710536 RepID=UPI000E26206D|nr:amidase [Halorussus litoreus]
MTKELCFESAADLVDDIRNGVVSPVAVVDAYLDRIAERNDEVNAYVTVLGERAREAAEEAERAVERGDDLGPLHGLPVAIKDLTEVAGVRMTFGAKPFEDHVAERDAAVVRRLEDAGAIVLGKTNTPEFGLKVTTDNLLAGPTSTPFEIGKNAGGSSGGSAAAVADGMAPLAEGSDAGGSVRIPSAFCGVVGFKPSYGRVPVDSRPDAFGTHTPFIHEGVHARTVADAALALDVLSGPDPCDPFSLPDDGTDFKAAAERDATDLSVAYTPDFGIFPIDPAVRSVVEAAVEDLRWAGLSVEEVEVDLGHTLDELIQDTSMVQWEVSVATLADRLQEAFDLDVTGADSDQFPDGMVEMAENGREHSGVEYTRASRGRTDVFDGVQDVFDEYDIVVSPVTTVPPFENGMLGPSEVNGVEVDSRSGWFLTMVYNLTGHPAASVPAGLTDDGLPVGLQVAGRRFADEDVLAASAALEAVRPWRDDYPGAP